MSDPTYRVATLRDLNELTECSCEAFWDDQLFNAIHPRKAENPAGYKSWWRARTEKRLTEKNLVVVIAELPVQDEHTGREKKKIAGFAVWEKYGKESIETRWNFLRACENQLIVWQQSLVSMFVQNKMSDPEQIRIFMEDVHEVEETFWKKDGVDVDRWHLQLLGTSPLARRKGIGGRLVEIGIEKALRDGCDAALESSPLGLNLYKSKGFEVIGEKPFRLTRPDGTPIPSPILQWKNPNIPR